MSLFNRAVLKDAEHVSEPASISHSGKICERLDYQTEATTGVEASDCTVHLIA